jgi:hypothetical protein
MIALRRAEARVSAQASVRLIGLEPAEVLVFPGLS